MEALSAGVKVVSTDLGALPETTLGYAKLIPGFPVDPKEQDLVKNKYVKIFAKEIKKAIKEIRKGKFNPEPQIDAINKAFSWEETEKQWIAFNDQMW
jgi:glycosyltransferase involved in cell wall biosynthesis